MVGLRLRVLVWNGFRRVDSDAGTAMATELRIARRNQCSARKARIKFPCAMSGTSPSRTMRPISRSMRRWYEHQQLRCCCCRKHVDRPPPVRSTSYQQIAIWGQGAGGRLSREAGDFIRREVWRMASLHQRAARAADQDRVWGANIPRRSSASFARCVNAPSPEPLP